MLLILCSHDDYAKKAYGSPVINIEQPVYGEVKAEWHINKAGVIGCNQFIEGSEDSHHIRNINQFVILCSQTMRVKWLKGSWQTEEIH